MFPSRRSLGLCLAVLLAGSAAAQSRSNTFFRTIGNTWLGGSIYVAASMSASRVGNTSTAGANFYANVDAHVLRFTKSIAEVDVRAQNAVTNHPYAPPTQNAQASCRLKLAMITVWDRSARTTGDLGGISPRTYNLFPVDPTAAVGVGPFTVTLRGNAGVTLGAGAMVVLPTTTPEVRLVGSANTAVVTRASVAVGVSGFNAGVELQGRFAETRLTASLVANVLSGLSGSVSLTVQGITLKLIAFLEAFWVRVYSTTLTSWSAGGYWVNLL